MLVVGGFLRSQCGHSGSEPISYQSEAYDASKTCVRGDNASARRELPILLAQIDGTASPGN